MGSSKNTVRNKVIRIMKVQRVFGMVCFEGLRGHNENGNWIFGIVKCHVSTDKEEEGIIHIVQSTSSKTVCFLLFSKNCLVGQFLLVNEGKLQKRCQRKLRKCGFLLTVKSVVRKIENKHKTSSKKI